MFRISTILMLLSALTFYSFGQDLHFSQFNSAPTLLNPALTGVNGADFRAAINYKNQWGQAFNAPYTTFAGSFDMALGKHTSYSNFAGLGITFFTDRAGTSEFTTNQVNLSASYTITLNNDGSNFVSAGLYGGFQQRSINVAKLTFDSQFGTNGFDPNLPTYENIETDNLLNADVGAGLLWNFSPSKTSNIYSGFSLSHVNQPNQSFLGDEDERLYMKLTFHGGSQVGISNQVSLLPSFLLLKQGPDTEFNLGTMIKFKKSSLPTETTAFYIGAWYRLKDAAILNARVDFKGVNLGFSYDINISGLTVATKGNGGPELSVIYTGLFNKKRTTSFCPVL